MMTHRFEYRIEHWNSTQELERLLNKVTNEDRQNPWFVEHHKLGGDSEYNRQAGWTIFKRNVPVDVPLLQTVVPLTAVYEVLNKTPFGNKSSDEFIKHMDAGLKEKATHYGWAGAGFPVKLDQSTTYEFVGTDKMTGVAYPTEAKKTYRIVPPGTPGAHRVINVKDMTDEWRLPNNG